MNKKIKTILAAGLLTLGMAAQACTLAAWDDSDAGAKAGGPKEAVAVDRINRYSGVCALNATAGTVTNDGTEGNGGPTTETNMIVRFYFRAVGATGSATIFQTFKEDSKTTPIYTVTYDGANVLVTSNDGGTNATAQVLNPNTASTSHWHSVEIEWNQNGAIKLWADKDANPAQLPDGNGGFVVVAPDANNGAGTSGNATSVIESVVLGGTSSFDEIYFDEYESRRSTPIGRVVKGDASGDVARSLDDAILIINESLSPQFTIAVGNTDTDEDGVITFDDAVLSLNLYLTNQLTF